MLRALALALAQTEGNGQLICREKRILALAAQLVRKICLRKGVFL
jgi:hypothetical protein